MPAGRVGFGRVCGASDPNYSAQLPHTRPIRATPSGLPLNAQLPFVYSSRWKWNAAIRNPWRK